MRVMVIVPGSKESEAGVLPDTKILAEMGKFNEELVKAGVLLAAEGLQPTSKGKRASSRAARPPSSTVRSLDRRSSLRASGCGR